MCLSACVHFPHMKGNKHSREISFFVSPSCGGMHSLRTSVLLSLSRTISHVLHAWHSCKGSRCHLSSFSRFSSGEGKVKGLWGRVLNRSFHPWISLDSFEWVWDTKMGETCFPLSAKVGHKLETQLQADTCSSWRIPFRDYWRYPREEFRAKLVGSRAGMY